MGDDKETKDEEWSVLQSDIECYSPDVNAATAVIAEKM